MGYLEDKLINLTLSTRKGCNVVRLLPLAGEDVSKESRLIKHWVSQPSFLEINKLILKEKFGDLDWDYILKELHEKAQSHFYRKKEKFTPKEKEILTLVLSGFSQKHIAKSNFLSYKTVTAHVRSIYRKEKTNSVLGLINCYLNSEIGFVKEITQPPTLAKKLTPHQIDFLNYLRSQTHLDKAAKSMGVDVSTVGATITRIKNLAVDYDPNRHLFHNIYISYHLGILKYVSCGFTRLP